MPEVLRERDVPAYVANTPDRRRFKLLLDPVPRGGGNLTGSRNLAAGLVILPPGQSQPATATHPATEEVLYVLRGRGIVELGGEAHHIEEGTVFYVPAGIAHRLLNSDRDEELRVFWANTPPLRDEEYKPMVEGWDMVARS